MAAKTRREAGQEFLDGILSKIPADQRDAVASALKVDAVLDDLGDGYLRQSDYTRQTAALATERQAMQEYYDKNNPIVARAAEVLKRFPDGKIPDEPLEPAAPTVDPDKIKGDVLGDVTKRLESSERGAMAFFAKVDDLKERHREAFGKPLVVSDLINNPRVMEVGLEAAYGEMFAEQYKTKAETELAAKLEAARKEGADAATAALRAQIAGQGQPYPTPNAARNPVMAALETQRTEALADPAKATGRPFVNRVDLAAAADDYHRLATQGGGG